jgi:hypothetical protein
MTDGITVTLRRESSDPCLNSDVLAVSREVVTACGQIIPADPPLGEKPFVVQEAPDGIPRACLNGLPSEYLINVTCLHKRLYARLAFQLGHELGHFYIDPRYSNWFIESVCTAISFLCLDALADKWASAPPFANWHSYAHHFAEYRRETLLDPLKKFGITDRGGIPTWICTSVAGLVDTGQFARPEEMLCADAVAEIMQLHTRSCSVITKLGAASQACGKTDFTAWRRSASSEEGKLVDDLNSLFGHIS